MEELTATTLQIVYRNEENGYTVATMEVGDAVHTAVGMLPGLREGERVVIAGEWTTHAVYGQQFRVSMCRSLPPDSHEGLIRYLSSGAISGVGPVTAKRIVDALGLDALDIIAREPQRLRRVEGIGAARAIQISQSLAEQRNVQQAMVFLSSLNLSLNMTTRIYRKYGAMTVELVQSDPYRLVRDIEGIGFKTADRIARMLGVDESAPTRMAAGILYLLQESAAQRGHTCLPADTLYGKAAALLGAAEEQVVEALRDMVEEGSLAVVYREGAAYVYLRAFLEAEQEVARRLSELADSRPRALFDDPAEAFKTVSVMRGICLAQGQEKAVYQALSGGLTIITGGPGTGKTTTINCILGMLELAGVRVMLAAPTGRAAKRMTQATGHEARTIHRMLEYGFSDEEELSFNRNEDNPIACGALIVDEMSMVDLTLMQHMLRAVPRGCRLVLVGDADQLPSVGPGNVLRDIIMSGIAPVTKLTEIFRQAQESLIVVNAHRVNEGRMPELACVDRDFFFERKDDSASALEAVEALVSRRIPSFHGGSPLESIQVLAPMKKGELGVYNLNARLQRLFNPPSPRRAERSLGDSVLREGDKVMQIRNNYGLEWRRELPGGGEEEGEGVFNGDVGFIERIDEEGKMLTVRFDDGRMADYEFAQTDELMLAYAVSIHKSQGSEFPVVVLPLLSGPPMLLTRNLLYTAITRAREMVVIVGRRDCVARMVDNDTVALRYSGLLNALRRDDGDGVA
ncbi:MAG: ATP-dependent RecD-like DNA helicase [Clostridiales bacterium]|nr:ATP-dependent RecD-like DNA helicase [Clostridiales bacterium]